MSEWQERLEKYRIDVKDIDSRFGPGSVGWHELWDRVHVQHEVWEDHVATHPAVVLDAEVFALSEQISELMGRMYARVGELGWNEDCKDADQSLPHTDRH